MLSTRATVTDKPLLEAQKYDVSQYKDFGINDVNTLFQTKQMDTSQVPSIPPDDKNAQQDPHWPWSVLNIARRQECPAGFALALVNGRVVVPVVGEG